LPIELAQELADFNVATVHGQGWLRLRNGVLLRAAVSAGFTVILTADTDLRHQQNLPRIGIGAVVVTNVRNRIEELRPLLPKIITALKTVGVGETIEVTG
jgi:hypothetical protein